MPGYSRGAALHRGAVSSTHLVRELRSAQGNDFILMLSHRNDELAMWSQLGVQLVLSGHCHGGVVRLPFVGGVFGTRRELFPEYDVGVAQPPADE